MIALFLQLFVSSRIRKIGKNMTLILNSKDKVFKYRDYTVYISGEKNIRIDEKEAKLSFFGSKEKVHQKISYTIFASDDIKLKINKRELKLSWIEKTYLKSRAKIVK